MARIHLFEIADQPWCPKIIRRAITEFLATVTQLTKVYQPTAQILADLLGKTKENTLLVIGAGSGGGIMDILDDLPSDTKIILTDILPDSEFKTDHSRVQYRQEPVDAFNLPKTLPGIWVMFTCFHHFPPAAAKRILGAAVATQRPIAIFECAPRSISSMLLTPLVPLSIWLLTPFVRPFRWSRLLLTYIVPIYPIIFFWDALVSNLRTYGLEEMKELTASFPGYEWDIRYLKGQTLDLPMLVGRPKPN
jgi:hypothetical protein